MSTTTLPNQGVSTATADMCQECTNDATLDGFCEFCYDHKDHEITSNVRVYFARLGGELRAACRDCGLVWAYWDCPCEFAHECDGIARP